MIDEIRTGLSYYVMTLFEAVAKVYEGIAADFREVYGTEIEMLSLPVCVRFGSWIGGDRDGNPLCVRRSARARRWNWRERMVLSHYIAGTGAAGAAADGFHAPGAGVGGVAANGWQQYEREHRGTGGGVVAHAAGRGLSPLAA